MKKVISVLLCMAIPFFASSCSDKNKESNPEKTLEVSSNNIKPLSYEVDTMELNMPISLPNQNPSFTFQVSPLWETIDKFTFGREITKEGLFFVMDCKTSNDYSTNTQFINKYIESFPDWYIYVNTNGVTFVTDTDTNEVPNEKGYSVYRFYNNGTINSIYFETKDKYGAFILSQKSIDNILNTILLIEEDSN